LDSWVALVEEADWSTPHDVVKRFPKAKVIGGNNVVFKICGNNYRLWVLVAFKSKNVMILKIGTHSEYDRWDIK
jgi:mRNA interferase HigB